MQLTKTERWVLSNQYRILERLYPDEADSLAKARIALESGYELEYSELSQHIYDDRDVLTEAECSEVHDILQMFTELKHNYERLEDKPNIDTWQIEFLGFDGNNELKQLTYTRYLRNYGDLYTDLTVGDSYNSHSHTLDRYRRQLSVWRRLENSFNMTKEQLEQIAAEAVNPSRR